MIRPLDPEMRRQCETLAAGLDLRILTILHHDGRRTYALWPRDGFAREEPDPVVASNYRSLHHQIWRLLAIRWLPEGPSA